jgi:DNA-binding NarL/FixJ family response regulator
MIRVLLVDDHEIVRSGLKMVLSRFPDIDVVGEAATPQETIEAALRLTPSVVLLDLRLKEGSGLDVCHTLRTQLPATSILILTAYADEDTIMRAVNAGADGYVLKEINSQNLVLAIRDVAAGKSVLDRTATQHLLNTIRDGTDLSSQSKFQNLSKQEARIMAYVAEGKTNKEIGELMPLSSKTVKNYLSNIMNKLGLTRRSQVAAIYTKYREVTNLDHQDH